MLAGAPVEALFQGQHGRSALSTINGAAGFRSSTTGMPALRAPAITGVQAEMTREKVDYDTPATTARGTWGGLYRTDTRIRRTHRYIPRAREPATGTSILLHLTASHTSRMPSRDGGMPVPVTLLAVPGERCRGLGQLLWA